jgi:hypothetical protein
MRWPTQPEITIDPELAILHVLDVAAGMAATILTVFHPDASDPTCRLDRADLLAHRIAEHALRLRHALLDYREHLDFERGPPDPDAPDDLPW